MPNMLLNKKLRSSYELIWTLINYLQRMSTVYSHMFAMYVILPLKKSEVLYGSLELLYSISIRLVAIFWWGDGLFYLYRGYGIIFLLTGTYNMVSNQYIVRLYILSLYFIFMYSTYMCNLFSWLKVRQVML